MNLINTKFFTSSPPLLFLVLFFISIIRIDSNIHHYSRAVQCLHSERTALLKFKAQLIDDYGRLTTWGNSTEEVGKDDCCRWNGVTCDNMTNHVVALHLHAPWSDTTGYSPLRGKIINESSLVELHKLRYLDLSFNDFEGSQIFESIYSLSNLQHLNLSESNFGGLIPQHLSNLSMLRYLDLSFNFDLIVNDLDWLGGLSSLEHLDLNSVNLERTSSTWIQTICNLKMLKALHLSSCGLSETNTTLSSINVSSTSLAFLDLSQNDFLDMRILKPLMTSTLSHLDLSYFHLEGVQFSHMMMLLSNSTKLEFLDFTGNKLGGTFPNMSRFSFLKELILKENELNGSLIEGNIRLPRLEVLDVSTNRFTGSIPNLTISSSLRVLDLSGNMFNGTLTEGQLSNSSRLRDLDLSSNSNLTVRINSSWNPPFQLNSLALGSCNLGPKFPKWLQTQKKLVKLDISFSQIHDAIPVWFGESFRMLTDLDMSNNQIHGIVPDLSHLSYRVDLSSNQFNGPLPLLNLTLATANLSNNNFLGTTIHFFNRSTSFIYLDLSNNLLSGELLRECFTNPNLYYLSLSNNNFSGQLPNSISPVCQIKVLLIGNNSLEGEIPTSLSYCRGLQFIELSENKLTGRLPTWLGESMAELEVLSVKSNNFYGSLPLSLCSLTNVKILDLSINNFSGIIPKCFDKFTSLSTREINYFSLLFESVELMWKGKEALYLNSIRFVKLIDLSSNNFVGEIPSEITSLVGLIALNLSRNNLVGPIPHDIGKLESLDFLDLSENNLSGRIPASLSQLSQLGVLNLSFNNFSGRIPWLNHLTTFGESTFMGNPGLCGDPLQSKPCPEDLIPQKPMVGDENSDSSYISDGLYISIAIGFITSFCVVVGSIFHNKICRVMFLKMITCSGDWLYVKILVYKNRLKRQFEN